MLLDIRRHPIITEADRECLAERKSNFDALRFGAAASDKCIPRIHFGKKDGIIGQHISQRI
jgi:hypothetical protein